MIYIKREELRFSVLTPNKYKAFLILDGLGVFEILLNIPNKQAIWNVRRQTDVPLNKVTFKQSRAKGWMCQLPGKTLYMSFLMTLLK